MFHESYFQKGVSNPITCWGSYFMFGIARKNSRLAIYFHIIFLNDVSILQFGAGVHSRLWTLPSSDCAQLRCKKLRYFIKNYSWLSPEIRCNNNFYFHNSFIIEWFYPLHCLFLSILVFRNWGNRFAWRAKTQIIPDCPLFDDCYYSSVVFISESNGALSKLMTLKILIFKLLVPLGWNLNWKYFNRAVMKFEFEKSQELLNCSSNLSKKFIDGNLRKWSV